jgi:general secretion pathway protein G
MIADDSLRHMKHLHRTGGFTMVEIIVVIIIIGVLVTLIVPSFISRTGQAQQAVAKQKLASIEQTVQLFYYDYGRFPRSLDELVQRPADIDAAKWDPPSLKAKDLDDPWGRRFGYRVPGQYGPVDLYCLGADGQEGGEHDDADIHNW